MVNRGKKANKWVGLVKDGYHSLMGKDMSRTVNQKSVGAIDSYKKGGKVKRTGLARHHAGEIVLSAPKVKMLKKLLA